MVTSGRDETLTRAIYTGGIGLFVVPRIRLANYSYTIPVKKDPLLSKVAEVFGDSLREPLPKEHQAIIDRGETQSEEDMEVVHQMQNVQSEFLPPE